MRSSIKLHYLLFLLWPFLACILALRRGFDERYQGILIAFSFLYGYTVFLYSGDILRYEEAYYLVAEYSWSDLWFIITNKLDPVALSAYKANTVNQKPDIFALITMFVTSRISETPRLFWGVVSMIYTWFMLLFFYEIKRHFDVQKTWIHYLLIFFLIIVIPKYVGVTGVRFWPALFLFLFLLMRYVGSNYSFKYILATFLTVLIHYSFAALFGLIMLFHFVPVKRTISKILVVISMSVFTLTSTTSLLSFLSVVVEVSDDTTIGQSMESYSEEDVYEQRMNKVKNTNWYVQFRATAHYYFFFLIFLLDLLGFFKIKESVFSKGLLPVIVIFFCVALLTINLGSLGRFNYIFVMLVLTRYITLYQLNAGNYLYRILGVGLAPIVMIYFLVLMRSELYYVEPQLLVNNSLGLFMVRSPQSLSELLIGH